MALPRPMFEVIAPDDLPAGYTFRFDAGGGEQYTVQVPPGGRGVSAGDRFTPVFVQREKQASPTPKSSFRWRRREQKNTKNNDSPSPSPPGSGGSFPITVKIRGRRIQLEVYPHQTGNDIFEMIMEKGSSASPYLRHTTGRWYNFHLCYKGGKLGHRILSDYGISAGAVLDLLVVGREGRSRHIPKCKPVTQPTPLYTPWIPSGSKEAKGHLRNGDESKQGDEHAEGFALNHPSMVEEDQELEEDDKQGDRKADDHSKSYVASKLRSTSSNMPKIGNDAVEAHSNYLNSDAAEDDDSKQPDKTAIVIDHSKIESLREEARKLEELVQQSDSSPGMSLDPHHHDIIRVLIADKHASTEEELEKRAILSNPRHAEFYLTFSRKTFGMISACESLASGMVAHGSLADSMRGMSNEKLRKTMAGAFVERAGHWLATQAASAIPAGDAVYSVFNMIVSLRDERERYIGIAHVADAGSLIASSSGSNLRVAVERLSRMLVRARESALTLGRSMGTSEDLWSQDCSRLRKAFLSLLGNQTNTPIKEAASVAADAALETLMKPESLLLDALAKKDSSRLVDSWAAVILDLHSLEKVQQLPVVEETNGAFQTVLGRCCASSLPSDTARGRAFVNSPPQRSHVSHDPLEAKTNKNSPDTANRRDVEVIDSKLKKIQKQVRVLQKNSQEIGETGGHVYADYREKYKDNVLQNTVDIEHLKQQSSNGFAILDDRCNRLERDNKLLIARVEQLERDRYLTARQLRTKERKERKKKKNPPKENPFRFFGFMFYRNRSVGSFPKLDTDHSRTHRTQGEETKGRDRAIE